MLPLTASARTPPLALGFQLARVPDPTPLDALLTQQVILELDALTNNDMTFLIETLVLWIHHYRLQDGSRERFKHAIVVEEAHHVLFRSKEAREGIMDVTLRETRELGEAIIVIDQHPSLISLPSLGNSYCTIAMNLKHGTDVRAIGKAMLLAPEQQDYLGRLDVGTGIVKLQGRWQQPFVVSFPCAPITKGTITDGDLRPRAAGDSAAKGTVTDDHLRAQVVGDSAARREILPVRGATDGIPALRSPDRREETQERENWKRNGWRMRSPAPQAVLLSSSSDLLCPRLPVRRPDFN